MMSKKIITGICAFAMVSVFTLPVAAEAQDSKTTLTTQVPSTYTLTIPKSQEVEYGVEDTAIEQLEVEGNIRTDQNLTVSVEKTDFVNTEKNSSFAFQIFSGNTEFSSVTYTEEQLSAVQSVPLSVHISEDIWDTLDAGTYTATLTFTAEIQNAQ